MLETDQYWGDVSYVGVVEAQGSILRSSSMWMVSFNLLLGHMVTDQQLKNVNNLSFLIGLLFLATGEPADDYTGTKFDYIWSRYLIWMTLTTIMITHKIS